MWSESLKIYNPAKDINEMLDKLESLENKLRER